MIGVLSPERCTSAIHDPQPPLIGPFSERIRSHRDEPERPWADPIYCAETLSEAFLYLPTCEYFKSVFMGRTEQKLVNKRIVQYKTATRIKPIYYVIDGDPEIYTSTCVLFQSAFPLPDLPTAVVRTRLAPCRQPVGHNLCHPLSRRRCRESRRRLI
jgi:hypothetical protein